MRVGLPAIFREFLERVVDEPEKFCHRSYLHPANGFYKIELGEILGGKLRLHVWPEGSTKEGDIHDHRWDFLSHILVGAVVERRFESMGGRLGYDILTHVHPYDRETLLLVPDEMKCVQERHYYQGESYTCLAGEIHQAFPLDGKFTATMVLTGPPNGRPARVFRKGGIFNELKSVSLEPEVLMKIVLRVLNEMKGPDGFISPAAF